MTEQEPRGCTSQGELAIVHTSTQQQGFVVLAMRSLLDHHFFALLQYSVEVLSEWIRWFPRLVLSCSSVTDQFVPSLQSSVPYIECQLLYRNRVG